MSKWFLKVIVTTLLFLLLWRPIASSAVSLPTLPKNDGIAISGSAQIVFQSQSPNQTGINEIVTMNLDGSSRQQITNDGKNKFLPHFSPDGRKILYTKFTVGGYGSPDAVTDIAVFDRASNSETLLTSGGNNGYATWSPDGSRIAYINGARLGRETGTTTLVTITADGSNPVIVGSPSGAPDDWIWSDIAWSRDNWILVGVATTVNGAFCKSRLDKIRPDGSSRTMVSDGGTSCTPPGAEAIGDADPGWSSDSRTIYSSRGLPVPPAGGPASASERKLYAFSSDPWSPGKVEQNLSFPSEPSCVEGVPKGSPDGRNILLFRACFDTGVPVVGIYLTDTTGSYRTFVTYGFGPDWNPVAAGSANVSGSVTSPEGRGVSSALISITDNLGNPRYSTTNPLGHFRFFGVSTGQSYVVAVRSKRFVFASQVINLSGDLTNVDFIAVPSGFTTDLIVPADRSGVRMIDKTRSRLP